jgi:hypothetical protein
MTVSLVKTAGWLLDIDNTLKDEAEARALHNHSHITNIQQERARYEAMILEQTPTTLSEVASMMIAISEMIERAERSDLGTAISAIGQRLHRETLSLAEAV